MQRTEATPLIRGRAVGYGPRAPSDDEESEEGVSQRSRPVLESSRAPPPCGSARNQVFFALLVFGVAMVAGFISATKTFELHRLSSQKQPQQQQSGGQGEGAGGGREGDSSDHQILDGAVVQEGSNDRESLATRIGDLLSGGVEEEEPDFPHYQQHHQAQQQQLDSSNSIALSHSAATAAATAVKGDPESSSNGHGLASEDHSAVAADLSGSEGHADSGTDGGDEAGAVRSDGRGGRAGGGWRSNGSSRNTGTSDF